MRTLVEMGPDSLPFLLDALDDKTPTKMRSRRRDSPIGLVMGLTNELCGNPANPVEARVLGPDVVWVWEKSRSSKRLDSYTVKVGDLCLVAIGEIVGRGYHAARFQPTNVLYINSPTEDAKP